jgi:RNA polymerase sigma-70 factor (ECF subfamily)
MQQDDSDAKAMWRLQHGEDTALNELMQRWQEPVANFIYRYVGNRSEALDLAQETFVRVFENRLSYKASEKFSTWLFTIASNLSKNYLRWQRRHPTVPLNVGEELGMEPASPEDSPSDIAEKMDLASAVKQHIQALPHDLKTAVLLFEYEDRSYEEIAAVLGCSVKAVETRLYRAREILRRSLARWKN